MIRRFLNGETRLSKPQSLYGKKELKFFIAMQREPGELKHLSNRRKRKKKYLSLERKFDFLSSGERKGKSLNHGSNTMG